MEALLSQVNAWNIELDSWQLSLLSTYAEVLAGYELANVIGTRERNKIVLEHLVDSLSCLVIDDMRQGRSLIDVGTGGGLPGIPLAIARPELSVTLLEPTEKKVRFLEYAKGQLDLRNVRVVRSRAEELGGKAEYRETFELATARALAPLSIVIEYCAPLVCTGGTVVAMKGRVPDQELDEGNAASRELGMELSEIREVKHHVQLPQKERRLIVLTKVAEIPSRFPRRVGLAKKRPLGT